MPGIAESPKPPRDAAQREVDEIALVRAVARKDRGAFETLYYLYAPRLGRYLSRLLRQRELVDEALNDVMLVLWQSAERFDPNASKLSTWLFGIAHNKALKALERSYRHAAEVTPLEIGDADDATETFGSDDPSLKADPHNPEQVAMGRQLGRALTQALENLSEEHRAVIELAFGQDCSYQEIATITGCPVNTVKTRMFYARKYLAQLLASQGLNGYANC
jgi:RNA polymerase sigma-70 factor, ECF subfamily